ncbi:ceramide synthase 2 isoform X1 [Passer domesticus]
MAHLGNCILAAQPLDSSEGLQLNFQQNISDTMTVLPKLSTGLDVNVRFTGVSDFEYTPECIVFDLLNIPLYHGWLVDPQSPEQAQAVGRLSYNQLVEKIITCKHSGDSGLLSEGLLGGPVPAAGPGPPPRRSATWSWRGSCSTRSTSSAFLTLLLLALRSMFQTLYSYFWWERLWLPANLTWADLEDRDGRVYAKASDLYITLPLAFLFLVVRHLFETYVATPLAGLLNVKEKVRLKATPNAVLEKFYAATSKHPKQADVEVLARRSGCTVRQVERWFRRRRNQDRPSLLKKFREASWRFTFYLIAFIAGMAVIVDKPWFYDLREVWKGYPIQSILPSQYWYYMIELSFYWSLLFSIASDVKRKDFKEQIIHHVATIILISFSWFANYVRAGTLIMALHDSSDYLLESAKMFNYAGWRNTCNNIFIVFAAVFIITRLVILPFWIMHCTMFYPLELYPAFFGYYFFNFMMVVLQSLHIFWAYLIIRMAQKFITGKVVEDERSDREETDNSEEEEEVAKNGPLSNGHPVLNNNHRKTD